MPFPTRFLLVAGIALSIAAVEATAPECVAEARRWLFEPIGDPRERGAGKAERVEWAARGFLHRADWTPWLIAWAKQSETPARERAIAALAEFAVLRLVENEPVVDGDPLQEVLLANLKDRDASIRARSAEALAYCRGPAAIPCLIAAARDVSEAVRVSTTDAMGHYRDRRTIVPLLAALRDPSPAVRNEAADAIWSFGDDKRVVDGLIEALLDPASGPAVGNLIFALEAIGARVETIREIGHDPREEESAAIVVGYRVKAPGAGAWAERRWPRGAPPRPRPRSTQQ